MDESKILADVLERLDRVTEHIITIKSDMYKASDFRVDSGRIYDALAKIQTEVLQVVKEAVTALDARLNSELKKSDEKCAAYEPRVKKLEAHLIPSWVYACAGAVGAALLHEALPTLLTTVKGVHP